jgi:hypothetical protein
MKIMLRFHLTILLVTMWLLFLSSAPALSTDPDVEGHRYIETVGTVAKQVEWCAMKGETRRIIYRTREGIDIVETDELLHTLSWETRGSNDDIGIKAVRNGNTISVSGRIDGSTVQRSITVDNAPWFQIISWSLRLFVMSSDSAIEFWYLRPDTLEAYKMTAQKKDIATMMVAGRSEHARLVELRPQGPLSIFWKGRYWFADGSGVFLKAETPTGPPGAPVRTVVYQGSFDSCR